MRLSNLFRSPILLILVVVVAFLVVQPRIQHILFPQARQASLNTFVQKIKQNHDVDLAAYWQFRDFYSPGSFHYDKSQLRFTSSKITSVGRRTMDKTIPLVLDKTNKILFQSSSVILAENTTEVTLIFLKPIAEEKKVNGFLEHDTSSDDKNGTMWLEVTRIKKD